MLKAIWETYRISARFARACPWLFLIPVVPELTQHIVEYKIGMLGSIAAAKAVEHDRARMICGSIKVLVLLLPAYWAVRFAWWNDANRARKWNAAGLRGYLPVLLYAALINLSTLWGPQLVGGRGGNIVTIAALPLLLVINTLLSQWLARAPLGQGADPIRSILVIGPDFIWAFLFGIVAVLPAMIVHYALNYIAMGRVPVLIAGLLALDALFVGFLTLIICVIPVTVTRHAEAKAACHDRPVRAAA